MWKLRKTILNIAAFGILLLFAALARADAFAPSTPDLDNDLLFPQGDSAVKAALLKDGVANSRLPADLSAEELKSVKPSATTLWHDEALRVWYQNRIADLQNMTDAQAKKAGVANRQETIAADQARESALAQAIKSTDVPGFNNAAARLISSHSQGGICEACQRAAAIPPSPRPPKLRGTRKPRSRSLRSTEAKATPN